MEGGNWYWGGGAVLLYVLRTDCNSYLVNRLVVQSVRLPMYRVCIQSLFLMKKIILY